MSKAGEWLRLARPRQWTKNLLVMAAMLFAARFGRLSAWLTAGAAFVSFCFLSASVYALNDLLDAELDRKHPVKKNRPVAKGTVSRLEAALLAGLWAGAGLGLALWLGLGFLACAVAYLA